MTLVPCAYFARSQQSPRLVGLEAAAVGAEHEATLCDLSPEELRESGLSEPLGKTFPRGGPGGPPGAPPGSHHAGDGLESVLGRADPWSAQRGQAWEPARQEESDGSEDSRDVVWRLLEADRHGARLVSEDGHVEGAGRGVGLCA